jgi:hypothetical protein
VHLRNKRTAAIEHLNEGDSAVPGTGRDDAGSTGPILNSKT